MVNNRLIDILIVADEMNSNLLSRKINTEINSNIVIHKNGQGLMNDAVLYENLDIVIVDQQYTKENLKDAIKSIKRKSPGTQVVVLSSDKGSKAEITDAGAYEFIYKDPTAFEKVSYMIKSFWIKKELLKENVNLKLSGKKSRFAIAWLIFFIVVILASFIYLVVSNSL